MKLILCVGTAIFLLLCLFASSVWADCPPCDIAQESMDGDGSGPNSRTVANVYIESSWNIRFQWQLYFRNELGNLECGGRIS